MILRAIVAAGIAAWVGGCDSSGPSPAEGGQISALAARVAALEQRKTRIEDVNAI